MPETLAWPKILASKPFFKKDAVFCATTKEYALSLFGGNENLK